MKDPTDRHAKLNARHTHAQFMSRYHVVPLVSRSTHREKSLIFIILTERVETMTQFYLFLYEEVRKRVHIFDTLVKIRQINRVLLACRLNCP